MLASTTDDYDVVVVGGGPGGAATATFLARSGARVAVVEGTRFPRWHIGESLLAASVPTFRELGVLPALDRFERKLGSLWVWGATPSLIRLEMPGPGYAYQVERSVFDSILLDNARAAGVQVLSEHWSRDPVFDDEDRIVGLRVQPAGGAPREVRCGYLVDASGLFQYLPKRLGLPMDHFGPRRAAVAAYWEHAARPSYPYRSDVISEACADGWLWWIPFAGGATGVGFVGDAEDITDTEPWQLLSRQVDSTHMIRRLLATASVARRPRVLKYTNHTVAAPLWDRGYVLVGDTAAFVDPLFSTGINATMYSAALASAGLIAVLAGRLTDADAAQWYDRRVRGHYRRTTEMTRLLYSCHPGSSRFWRSRSLESMTSAAALKLIADIGARDLEFFAKAVNDGALSLPPALHELLSSIGGPPMLTRLPRDTVVSLAAGIQLTPDWARRAGSLIPVTRVAHQHRHTHEFDIDIGSPAQRLLAAISTPRRIEDLISACGVTDHDRARFELLAGALATAGILRTSTARRV